MAKPLPDLAKPLPDLAKPLPDLDKPLPDLAKPLPGAPPGAKPDMGGDALASESGLEPLPGASPDAKPDMAGDALASESVLPPKVGETLDYNAPLDKAQIDKVDEDTSSSSPDEQAVPGQTDKGEIVEGKLKMNDEFRLDLTNDLQAYLSLLNEKKNELTSIFQEMIEGKDKSGMNFRDVFDSYFDKSYLSETMTSETLENNMKSIFPFIQKVVTNSNNYMTNASLTGTFNVFFQLYCHYPEVLSFISPWLIGKYFFRIEEKKQLYDYDMDRMIIKAIELDRLGHKSPISKMLAISFMNSRKDKISFISDPGEKLESKPSSLNKINLTYLTENERLLSKVIESLTELYVVKGNIEIDRLLKELVESGSHNTIVNLFRTNEQFMDKVSENKELFTLLAKKEIIEDLLDKKPVRQLKKKLNLPGKITCDKEVRSIMDKVNKGEPFTFRRDQALLLEFCTKAMDNLDNLLRDE